MASGETNFASLPSKTSPSNADMFLLEDTEDTKKINYSALADAILNKLTSKTYSGLDTSAKNLVSAINELNSKSQNIAERFYMIMISTEDHTTVKIKFNNTTRNFMLIFGSANKDPYLGIADLKGIQEISDAGQTVNIQRDVEQSDLYTITCPAWSTFFIIGDVNYLKNANISYS